MNVFEEKKQFFIWSALLWRILILNILMVLKKFSFFIKPLNAAFKYNVDNI